MTECPKCHYVRKPNVYDPASECPQCGIVYKKFVAPEVVSPDNSDFGPSPSSASTNSGPDIKTQAKPKPNYLKIVTIGITLLPILSFIILGLLLLLLGEERGAEGLVIACAFFLLSIPVYFFVSIRYCAKLGVAILQKPNTPQNPLCIDLTSGTPDHSAPARIFVVRKSIRARSSQQHYVTLDGEVIAELWRGEYTMVEVAEGEHEIGHKGWPFWSWRRRMLKNLQDIEVFNLEFEGGRSYYFSFRDELSLPEPALEHISADDGDKFVNELKHIPAQKKMRLVPWESCMRIPWPWP